MNRKEKRTAKKAVRAAQKAAKKYPAIFTVVVVILIIALIAAACWYFFFRERRTDPPPAGTVSGEELSIHFPELGNRYAGDCVFLHVGDTDVLIDGGSRESSADTIARYVGRYCTDGILEYVIVTHADRDHIAAFAGNGQYRSLFERFECKTIIDFPRTNKDTETYARYVAARDAEVRAGAVHYTALQCYRGEGGAQRTYRLAEGIEMTFLYNYFYDHASSDENNYSVCMYVRQGEYNYLFTGDLEREGERYLVENNRLPRCKLYKAGHHGSKTSSTEVLLDAIRPEYVCVCCCAGSPEYTSSPDSTFPTRATLERLMKYTRNIFVTTQATDVDLEKGEWGFASLNGDVVFRSDGSSFTVSGSASSLPLPDSPWFARNRA